MSNTMSHNKSAFDAVGLTARSEQVSDRVAGSMVSPIKEIAYLASQMEDVIPFAWGIPAVETPRHIRVALQRALDDDSELGIYSPSLGVPELRRAIVSTLQKDFGTKFDADSEVLVTAGAMQGLMNAILTVVNPGDEVIMTSPGFSSHVQQIMLAGGTPVFLPMLEEQNWALDLAALPKLITNKTKAIIICSPSNPTGHIFTRQELDVIADLVLQHNLILITDEPYQFLTYDGKTADCLVADDRLRYNRISCFSFSKQYAMTGYRVGYTIAEPGMIRAMLKVHDATIVSAPRPSQIAALAALEGDQACVTELRQTLQDRRDVMCSELDTMTQWLTYVQPEGSYYVFPKLASKLLAVGTDVDLAVRILKEAKVSVVPGSAFGNYGDGHLRLCFGATPETITKGMTRLHNWLQKNY